MKYEIIGVIKNFNYESLHQLIRPLVIHLFDDSGYGYGSICIGSNFDQKFIKVL